MKRCFITIVWLAAMVSAVAQTVSKTPNGVRVDAAQGELATEVVFYTPSAVRITKYPKQLKAMPEHKSYSIIAVPEKNLGLTVDGQTGSGTVKASSECLSVVIDTQTGNVSFDTKTGEPLLRETASKLELIAEGVDKGQYKVSQTWQLEKEEVIIGLGQRSFSRVNQRNQHANIWTGNTYDCMPYFASEKGYGLYWDNAGESTFDDNAEGTTFASSVARLEDYYFMYRDGSQDGVIAAIRSLTGQATMFPLWTMGYWQCRERYKTSDELCDVLDKYRELGVPLDGIVQDWQYWGQDSNWNAMKFENPYYINKVGDEKWAKYLPDDLKRLAAEYVASGKQPRIKSPEEMVKYVHEHHAHLMISIWPDFGPWTAQYADFKKINALYPFDTWPRNRGVLVYDPYNPKARDIYWDYLRNLYNLGFDAWWTDSTEPDHSERPGDRDYLTHDGSWRSVKNAFALVTNRGIYEHQRAEKKKVKGVNGLEKRSFQMTRSATFGIQHYGTFSWSGDISSDWNTMKNQIPAGLNYIACGIPLWNTDIGGFFGGRFNDDCKNPGMQELQVRWMQWGCFMPLMRNHCSSPMINEIYHFGEPGYWAYDVQKQYIELRYRLLPYIYSNLGDVVLNSGSMMRPLMFDFAKDKRALAVNDEYMFGRNLLVKPVTDPLYTWQDNRRNGYQIYPDMLKAAAPVDVYLPEGTEWFDFWTGQRMGGGQYIKRLAPIDIIPVYVRAGTVLPWGPAVQYSDEKPWDNLTLKVYPGADGNFTLYEDEGDGYNYERGQYTLIPMHWDEASQTLTIGTRQGSYKGMIQSRTFQVELIGKDGSKTVSYSGNEVKVTM